MFQVNSAITLSACTLYPEEGRTPRSYLRAILAGDGVAIFWVLDKRYIHTNERSPIRGYYLASDERNQAARDRNTSVSGAHRTERPGRLNSSLLLTLPHPQLVPGEEKTVNCTQSHLTTGMGTMEVLMLGSAPGIKAETFWGEVHQQHRWSLAGHWGLPCPFPLALALFIADVS
jgi:hypothetical protein